MEGQVTCGPWTDTDYLNRLDERLPEELEYVGEFGTELILFTPFCGWLAKAGLLRHRTIKTYVGMRCFYDDLECGRIKEKEKRRTYVPPDCRPSWLPIRNEHDFDGRGRPLAHHYPDLRARFSRLPLLPEIGSEERPILIVHNKYNIEWDSGTAINYVPLAVLDQIFSVLKSSYTIVYVRHGMQAVAEDFIEDHNTWLPFNERPILSRHPEIVSFSDLYCNHHQHGGTQDLNTFKNVLYSRCHHFISTQGGGAHHIAFFSGSVVVILHRSGREEEWAYANGYYSFVANPAPYRAICRTDADLVEALALFLKTRVIDGRVLLDADRSDLLARFSPFAACPPRRPPVP